MALDKVLYPLVIDGGIDTKTDAALLPVGKNLISENTDFQEYGSINKISGFVSLPSVASAKSIISHNDQILTLGANGTDSVYSYDESTGAWLGVESDPLSPMVFIDEEHNGDWEIQSIDSFENTVSGHRFTACIYLNANGLLSSHQTKTVIYKTDYLTGSKKVIVNKLTRSSVEDTYEFIKVNGIQQANSNIWVTRRTVGGISYIDIYDENGTSIYSSTHETSAGFWFDTIVDGSILYYVGQKSSSAFLLRATWFNQDGSSFVKANIDITGQIDGTIQSNIAIAIKGNNLYASYCDNVAYKIRMIAINKSTFAGAISDTVIATIGVSANKLSLIETGTGASDNFLIICNGLRSLAPVTTATSFGTYDDSYIYALTVNPTTFASSYLKTFYEPGSIASKLFTISGLTGFFFISQSLTVDYFKYNLYKIDLTKASAQKIMHLGSFAVLTALGDNLSTLQGYLLKNYLLAKPQVGNNSKLYVPLIITERSIPLRQTDDDSIVFSGVRVGKTFKLDFSSEYSNISCKLGENTAIAGATIKNYDSLKLMNGVLLDAPEIQRLEEVTGTNAAGTYSYKGLYEFTDNNGQIWRSTESIPRTITIVGGKSVKITWNQMLPTDLKNYIALNYPFADQPSISSIKFILYRTTNGGTIYYRIGYVTAGRSALVNGLFLNPWTDNLVDALITGNESLYTNGGVLSNDTLPPIKYLVSSQNRMFALSSEDENLIYYSQPYLAGENVNWSLALSTRIDSGSLNKSGKVIALASMDGKVICFKNNSIIAFAGDGPNQLGEDNNFTNPQTISTTIGCSEPKSVETIPGGVIFKSPSGIYLLDRSLNLQYIGSDVEDYNSETIVGVANLSTKNSVCFLTANRTLVYEYIQGKWSTWSIGGESCCIWKNRFAVLKAGVVKYQDASTYKDGSTYYSMTLSTPWVKISGVQEYQRIYKLILFGQFKSAHTLTARIYFDYNETDYEDHVISPLITDSIYQYEVSLTNQKCQSFKIKINDNVDSGSGHGFKLTNITLQLGKKKGFNKLPSTRKY